MIPDRDLANSVRVPRVYRQSSLRSPTYRHHKLETSDYSKAEIAVHIKYACASYVITSHMHGWLIARSNPLWKLVAM